MSSTRMLPWVGLSRLPISCSSVVLPEPDRPASATSSPGSTTNPMSSSTSASPYRRQTCSTTTRAPGMRLLLGRQQPRDLDGPGAGLDHDHQRQLMADGLTGELQRVAARPVPERDAGLGPHRAARARVADEELVAVRPAQLGAALGRRPRD